MAPLILILLLVVPLVELWVIVSVAKAVGVVETILLLIVVSSVGAWLLKQQGMTTWRRLQSNLRRGAMPAEEVTDGALILLGGALLLTPGFVTDVVGLVLLLPPSRVAVKRAFRGAFGLWLWKRVGLERPRRPAEARVVKVERVPRDASCESPSSRTSSLDEGGSRDRS
jgi:UPF0716 protein FxsA